MSNLAFRLRNCDMERMTPLKAMRAKCLDCCAGSRYEVAHCCMENCPLFPYRFGRRPGSGRSKLTDEQRASAAECLRVAREARRNATDSASH